MKITRPEPGALRTVHSRRTFPAPGALVALLLALAFVLGAAAQAAGWIGVSESDLRLIVLAVRDPRFALDSAVEQSRLPTLYLDLEFQDVQRLRSVQASAQAVGVHVPAAQEAVSGTVRLDDHPISAQVRVLPGPAEPPGRWALEVTPTQGRLLGQSRLMLYHAAAHQALAQWGLAASLRAEGIAASPVQPVRLVLDGDELGVYGAWAEPAVEPPGSLVYFDTTLAWQDLRRNGRAGPAFTTLDLADCQVAEVASISANPQAVALLQDVQKGRRALSDVLDTERMATLLALAALWQGSPQIDWAQVQFSLDPAQSRLQPVAGVNLIGRGAQGAETAQGAATAQGGETPPLRWPACYDDPALQAAFARAAERASRPEYLDNLHARLGAEFGAVQRALSRFGRPELTWDDLSAHQAAMRRWLEPSPILVAAWRLPDPSQLETGAAVKVSLANPQRLPVEVLGLDSGKSAFFPLDPAWIAPGSNITATASGTLVLPAAGEGRLRWVDLDVPYSLILGAARAVDEPAQVQVVARLLGLDRRQSVAARLEGSRP